METDFVVKSFGFVQMLPKKKKLDVQYFFLEVLYMIKLAVA